MEIFEIHITGRNNEIIKEFEKLKIKTLQIQLLDKNNNIVGFENMCSLVKKFKNYEECLNYVQRLLIRLDSSILRVKIETPYAEKYVEQSVYCEVHFPTKSNQYPTVRNVNSEKLVSTEREYDKDKYLKLKRKYESVEKSEFELCLHDSNTGFDDYWLSFYN